MKLIVQRQNHKGIHSSLLNYSDEEEEDVDEERNGGKWEITFVLALASVPMCVGACLSFKF